MHRNRTWTLDPPEWRTNRNRVLDVVGGDGSTLSLDFTTGVLDSRLVFTRTTNATFINSQGYVQYADANMIRNSVFNGAATPTSWILNSGGAGATIPSSGVRRCVTTTAAQNALNSASFSTVVGLVYATTVNIREVSGQHYRNAFEITASPTILKYYKNGVQVASGSGEFITAEAGLITVVWIATSATAHNLRLGVGATGANVANAVCEFECPHTTAVFFSGTTTANSPSTYIAPAYVPNTDTSAAYHAPRFDYDPTTLTPRGLLIEGSVVNYALYSNACSGTGWNTGGTTTPTPFFTTGPDGVANSATRYVMDYGGVSLGKGRFYYQTSYTTLPHTISIWMKSNTGSNQTVNLWNSSGTPVSCTVTPQWQRFQSVSTSGTSLPGYVYVENPATTSGNSVDISVWGAQLEPGSGASSYIPTGASQGNRAEDSVVMNDITSLNYSTTNGSVYWSGIINKQPTSYVTFIGFMTAGDQPTYETFGNALSFFTAARGATLNTGGQNEVSRPYIIGSLIKYASSINTLQDPIISVNLNQSTTSVNKVGTGDLRAATRFVIGRQPSTTYAAYYPSATIRNIKYWPITKTPAELNTLTIGS